MEVIQREYRSDYSIVTSLLINGLQSSAFLTMVAMVLVLALFLRTRVSIIIASLWR